MALLPEQAWTLPYMACATAISKVVPPSTLEGELPLAVADEEAPLAASDEDAACCQRRRNTANCRGGEQVVLVGRYNGWRLLY